MKSNCVSRNEYIRTVYCPSRCKNNNSKEQIFAYYNGKTFTHGALRITFNDGKLAIIDYNGAVYDYDKLKLVNGYILEIYKDNEVKKCLIFNYFKGYDNDEYRRSWELVISNLNDGKQNLYILKDSDDEKVRPQPNNKSENKIDAQTETDNVVSDEIKVSNGEKLIKRWIVLILQPLNQMKILLK